MDRFELLALAPVPDRETDLLRAAAVSAGMQPVDLTARWWELHSGPQDGATAWRVPTGAAALSAWSGRPLALAVAPPSWLARRPADVLGGRRLAVVTAADLAAGRVPFHVRFVKPAALKVRSLPAQRAAGTEDAARRRKLPRHRASWHEEASDFAADVLSDAAEDDVPPACVLDVARLADGWFALLETNTVWAAGLYGCDPDAVLAAVLAAQRPTDVRWSFDPGERLSVSRPRP